MPVVRSSVAESGTVTHALVPLKERALLNFPPVTQVRVGHRPLFPLPDWSRPLVPLPSSNAHAPTRPAKPCFGPLRTRPTTSSCCRPRPARPRKRVRAVPGGECVPGDRVGSRRVLGARVRPVDLELNARDRSVVRCVRGDGHRARRPWRRALGDVIDDVGGVVSAIATALASLLGGADVAGSILGGRPCSSTYRGRGRCRCSSCRSAARSGSPSRG